MKFFLIIAMVAMFSIETVNCCSCMGTNEDWMCSANFVAKVQVVGDQVQTTNGAYQAIEILEVYKGRDDITRAYSGTSGPGEPITSCDGYTLTTGESYVITGSYYGKGSDTSILYSGCQFVRPVDRVTPKQFSFLKQLTEEKSCKDRNRLTVTLDRNSISVDRPSLILRHIKLRRIKPEQE